jgi:hypothetical protein
VGCLAGQDWFHGIFGGRNGDQWSVAADGWAARPAFAALIYGGPFGVMPAIPLNLPPIFIAWAQDDEVAQQPVVKFYEALKVAGDKPEVHI